MTNLVRTDAVARMLGVSKRAIYNDVKRGLFDGIVIRFGRRRLWFDVDALRRRLEQGRRP